MRPRLSSRTSLACRGLFLWVALAAGPALAETPDQHAERIALAQPRVRTLLAQLRAEAAALHDSAWRKDALALLGTPVLSVIAGRRGEQAQIEALLQKGGLLEPEQKGPLFPSHQAMPFVAAAGGSWGGHHGYPGGLVDHTLVNLRAGLALATSYREVYQAEMDQDLIRLAALWHDCAKTLTLSWQEDGSLTRDEGRIAGTAAHHIWGVAEAAYRRYPARFVVTLAAAHKSPMAGEGMTELLGFLRAAAVIAGVPYAAVGLTADGAHLAELAPPEAFINYLDDHDYVLTVPAMQEAATALDEVLGGDRWRRDEVLASVGELDVYTRVARSGRASLRGWSRIVPGAAAAAPPAPKR